MHGILIPSHSLYFMNHHHISTNGTHDHNEVWYTNCHIKCDNEYVDEAGIPIEIRYKGI